MKHYHDIAGRAGFELSDGEGPRVRSGGGLCRVREFPCEVRNEEHVWIPLPDGSPLGARIWLPVNGEDRPVPATFGYLPYRKRGLTPTRGSVTHPCLFDFCEDDVGGRDPDPPLGEEPVR